MDSNLIGFTGLVISFVGLFVAFVALGIAIWQGWLTRRHNRLSVVPKLVSSRNISRNLGGVIYEYIVSNHGLGPARIRNFILYLKGEPVDLGQRNVIENTLRSSLSDRYEYELASSSIPSKGYAIKPHQDYLIARIIVKNLKKDQEQEFEESVKTDLRIEYESFYGQKFALDTRG